MARKFTPLERREIAASLLKSQASRVRSQPMGTPITIHEVGSNEHSVPIAILINTEEGIIAYTREYVKGV